MPLVDYDSSEDDENVPEVEDKTPAATTVRRPTEKKKIIVALATPASTETEPQGPRPKRIAGSSGLSSLLPPPKRPSRINPINTNRRTEDPVVPESGAVSEETNKAPVPAKPLFAPRSVSSATVPAKKTPVPLFTIHTNERPAEVVQESTDYKPLLRTSPPPPSLPPPVAEVAEEVTYSNEDYKYDASIDYASLPNFQPEPVERRQQQQRQEQARTDRRGHAQQPPAESAMVDYDLSREYDENERLASGEAASATAAPVRFVGSGKHQLSSLLSLAQSQRDSFEESFAAQKRAIRDGKARYGR